MPLHTPKYVGRNAVGYQRYFHLIVRKLNDLYEMPPAFNF